MGFSPCEECTSPDRCVSDGCERADGYRAQLIALQAANTALQSAVRELTAMLMTHNLTIPSAERVRELTEALKPYLL